MDSTIETLEIIIKARIDDALKNIRQITNEVKNKVASSTASMKKITESSQEVAKSLKPVVQETKKSMKQYESTIKETTSKVKNELTGFDLNLDFNTDEMHQDELTKKLEEIKEVRDSILGNNQKNIFSENESNILDEVVYKLLEIEERLKEINATSGNEALEAYRISKSGPLQPTITSDEHNGLNVDVNVKPAENKLTSLKEYIIALISGAKDGFKGLGQVIGTAVKTGVEKAKNALTKIKGTVNKVKDWFSKLRKTTDDTFSKGLKSIKKFALGLLSIRSAFSAISKSAQAYLSFDTQLNDSIQNSWNTLGSLLAPILEYIASLFSKVTSAIATFVKALTGIDLVAKANAKALNSQAKAAKNASNQTGSIDDISVLSSNKDNGSGNDIPTITNEGIDISLFDGILSRVREIIDAWKNGDWEKVGQLISQSFINAFNFISQKIKEIDFTSIGENISRFLTNIDFSGIFTSLITIFGEAILGLQDMFLVIDWPTIFKNLGDSIRDAIFKVSDYISQIEWGSIGQKLSDTFVAIDWGGIGSSILTMLWNGLSGIVSLFLGIDWGQVGKKISDSVHEWIETIITKFKETDWVQLGMDVANAIMDFILSVDWIQLGVDILNGLAEGIKATIEFVIGCFAQLLTRILEFFGIHSPSTVFAEMGTNMIQGLINGILELKDKVVSAFSNIWEGIKSVFSSVATFFKDIFSNAWQNVMNVFSAGGKIFDGIKEGIVSAFKTIVNGIINGINKVVKIPFDGINSALAKVRDISFLGISPFKNLIKTISVPQIPQLATGNVAYEETLAIFGEYSNAKSNPEITAPQSILKQTMAEALNDYAFNNNTGSNHITVQFGVERVVDEIIDEINKRISRRGVSVFREA